MLCLLHCPARVVDSQVGLVVEHTQESVAVSAQGCCRNCQGRSVLVAETVVQWDDTNMGCLQAGMEFEGKLVEEPWASGMFVDLLFHMQQSLVPKRCSSEPGY